MSDVGEPAARVARRVICEANVAGLATVEADGGPYASLVAVAGDAQGQPLLLISSLARHTRNLSTDLRVSLLFTAPAGVDPLNSARVSVVGQLEPVSAQEVRDTYLARHPYAKGYSTFPDFSFHRMRMREAHLVEGFGRIVTLPGEEVRIDWTGADDLLTNAQGIVTHMNEDHADAIDLYARHYLGVQDGEEGWRMLSIDPLGCVLIRKSVVRRLDFARRITSPASARAVLVDLVKAARAGAGD